MHGNDDDDGNIHDGLPRNPRGQGIRPRHHKMPKPKGKGRLKKSDVALAIDHLIDWEKLDFDGSTVLSKRDSELRRSANRKALEMLPHVIRMTMMILQHADKAADRLAAARFIKEMAEMRTDEKVVSSVIEPVSLSDDAINAILGPQSQDDDIQEVSEAGPNEA